MPYTVLSKIPYGLIRHTVLRYSGEIRQRGKVTSISIFTAGSPNPAAGLTPPPGLAPDLPAAEAGPGHPQLAAERLGPADPGLLPGLADLGPDAAGGQHDPPAPLRPHPGQPPLQLPAARGEGRLRHALQTTRSGQEAVQSELRVS